MAAKMLKGLFFKSNCISILDDPFKTWFACLNFKLQISCKPVNYECSEMLKVLDYSSNTISAFAKKSFRPVCLLAQTLKCKFRATCNLLSIRVL